MMDAFLFRATVVFMFVWIFMARLSSLQEFAWADPYMKFSGAHLWIKLDLSTTKAQMEYPLEQEERQ